jgi:hypothetical protein
MADFGTILNSNNKTLDLYCNSINCNNVNVIQPFLYASLEPYAFNTQADIPLIFNDIIKNKISVSQFPKIDFEDEGIYSLTASITGGSTFASIVDPIPLIYFKVYDKDNNLIQTSSGQGASNFGLEQIKNITQTFTTRILKGYYIYVILSISGAPPEFNILFSTGNLNICKISN